MKSILFRFRWLLALGLAPAFHAAEPLALPHLTLEGDAVELREWLIFGRFDEPSATAPIEVDFLARQGGAETNGSGSALLQLGERLRANGSGPTARIGGGTGSFNLARFYRGTGSPGSAKEQAAAYTACEITAAHEREAWLMFRGNSAAKIWLNGVLRHAARERHTTGDYSDAVMLPLKEGRNLLLIKIINLGVIAARLEPDGVAVARTALAGASRLLRNAIVPADGALQIALGGVPPLVPIEVELQNYRGSPVRAFDAWNRAPIDVAGLARGLYRLRLNAAGEQRFLPFYVGALAELSAEMIEKCAGYRGDERVKLNLDTLLRRIDILDRAKKADSGAGDRIAEIHHKAVFAATGLEDALGLLANEEEPFRHRPGLHLRAFRSDIDDQPMHYRLFVPSTYSRGNVPLPLAIMMPTVFEVPRPFIESVIVANHHFAEERAASAEKLGIGVLWPGYRVNPYGNPVDFAHLEEALAAVAADYDLDPQRIYLFGTCSSGMTAAMELVRNPERYAGMALLNPVLHRLKGRADERADFAKNITYRSWLQETDPLAAAAEVRDVPIRIIHDGGDAEGGPVSHSFEFVEFARAMGNRPALSRPQTVAVRHVVGDELLAWLAGHRREKAAPLKPAVAPPGGPLSWALAERFVVVRGTTGSEAQKSAAARWCREFQEAWQRNNFVSCRVVDDVRLTEAEEKTSNLVLIGNPGTNAVWQRLAAQLPATLEAEGVSAGGESWRGEGLALQTWCPHPDQPGRKIVLIGAHDLEHAGVGTMELALDGWFDFAVWQAVSREPRLVATGRVATGQAAR